MNTTMIPPETERNARATYALSHPVKLALTISIPLTFATICVAMFFYLRRVHLKAITRFEIAPGVGHYIPSRKHRRGRNFNGDVGMGIGVRINGGGSEKQTNEANDRSRVTIARRTVVGWIAMVEQILQLVNPLSHPDHDLEAASNSSSSTSNSQTPKSKLKPDGIAALKQSQDAWKREQEFKLKLSTFKLQQQQRDHTDSTDAIGHG
ncbi:hypothetical protein BJ508DRAFT_367590 [Ascobolus immersus RN42]|uniref:Uncharacterized protein n=1 Tax=Ascobolus immersus RN42 TaxID=1160509 RepID=A0A3N4HBH5_ASCIM|nr:hypothetical protein BJ508DRAFT_367590 [Ascobolus immersus RN42]